MSAHNEWIPLQSLKARCRPLEHRTPQDPPLVSPG